MSFSLNSAATPAAGYILPVLSIATLYFLIRYGPRLGESLRDEPGVPRVALRFFEAVGWIASIVSGLILGFMLVHTIPGFFLVGLSSWIYPCIGKTWAGGLLTLGPLLFMWLRRIPDRTLLFH